LEFLQLAFSRRVGPMEKAVPRESSGMRLRWSMATASTLSALTVSRTVRVLGINTPESGECFSTEAADALEDLIADRDLVLIADQTDVDQYERSLRYVETADGLDVGAALVAGGYAISRRYEPDVAVVVLDGLEMVVVEIKFVVEVVAAAELFGLGCPVGSGAEALGADCTQISLYITRRRTTSSVTRNFKKQGNWKCPVQTVPVARYSQFRMMHRRDKELSRHRLTAGSAGWSLRSPASSATGP
jgi:hypothetical protein